MDEHALISEQICDLFSEKIDLSRLLSCSTHSFFIQLDVSFRFHDAITVPHAAKNGNKMSCASEGQNRESMA
jgi:hypothetical protein